MLAIANVDSCELISDPNTIKLFQEPTPQKIGQIQWQNRVTRQTHSFASNFIGNQEMGPSYWSVKAITKNRNLDRNRDVIYACLSNIFGKHVIITNILVFIEIRDEQGEEQGEKLRKPLINKNRSQCFPHLKKNSRRKHTAICAFISLPLL